VCIEDEYWASSWKSPPKCVVCQDMGSSANHYSGSGKCNAHSRAIEKGSHS
jgi:hypothetical protein